MTATGAFLLDVPMAAIESADHKWTVGAWFEPCRDVTANAKYVVHDCFHVNPFLGTLAPGQSATAVGRVYMAKGSVDTVWKRMLNDWKKQAGHN